MKFKHSTNGNNWGIDGTFVIVEWTEGPIKKMRHLHHIREATIALKNVLGRRISNYRYSSILRLFVKTQ